MNEALRKAVECQCCGMPCDPSEYHPYAACLMFKACHNAQAVWSNLQAVQEAALATHRANYDALVIRLGEVTARLEAADGLLREALPEVHSNIGWMVLQDVKDGSMESSAAVAKRITTHLKAADHV